MPAATSTTTAADRVLQVLAVLAQQGRALSVGELMAHTGLARSTLYRQLGHLRHWGFVLESGGQYAPGPLSLQLAMGFDGASRLAHASRPILHELAARTHESVGLLVAVNDQAVCLDMVESAQSLRCSFDKGRGVPLLAGASAKCLLAHLPAQTREAVLLRQFDGDAHRRSALELELAAIAVAGFAVSEGEVDAGVWGCSVPVFGAARRLAGAITVMAPASRAQGHEARLTEQVAVAASRISRALAALSDAR